MEGKKNVERRKTNLQKLNNKISALKENQKRAAALGLMSTWSNQQPMRRRRRTGGEKQPVT